MLDDLIIIGGGASGTAMLQSLAAAVARGGSVRKVIVLERSTTPGPGLPYGEASDPFHTMGRTRTLRREKGLQLRGRFAHALERLRASGTEIAVHTNVEANELTRANDEWSVATDERIFRAPHVVLATGHWHVPRLRELERVVDWRWDVRRLHASVSDEEDVVVLGMGQSGLDVASSLVERRRGVHRAGKVRLASRHGLLPSVFGYIGGKQPHEPTRAVEALLEAPELRLSELVAAVRAGAESTALAYSAELPEWSESALAESIAAADGVAVFRREVLAAAESLRNARPIPWHPVLWLGMETFHELFPRLCAEDRLTLAARWTPIMRHVEAIHLDAAERLLASIDAGAVEICALGDAPELSEDQRGVIVRGTRGEARGTWLVDARGPDPRISHSDDALLKSLLESGVVVPGRVGFRGHPGQPVPGRVPFREIPRQPEPEGWSIERHEGRDWLVTGGLWVDPVTFSARDVSGRTHGLSALGPLTIGQFPFYAGLWATRRAAERIVSS